MYPQHKSRSSSNCFNVLGYRYIIIHVLLSWMIFIMLLCSCSRYSLLQRLAVGFVHFALLENERYFQMNELFRSSQFGVPNQLYYFFHRYFALDKWSNQRKKSYQIKILCLGVDYFF